MADLSRLRDLVVHAALRWKRLRGQPRAIEVEAERALLRVLQVWVEGDPEAALPDTVELDVMASIEAMTPELRHRILRWMLMTWREEMAPIAKQMVGSK